MLLPVLFGMGCFENSSTIGSEILPVDYQTSYIRIRSCLPDTGKVHGEGFQLIRANAAFLEGPPYAPGSVVVSEQHGDPGCESLLGIYVMVKEPPGYDTQRGDWHYQRLSTIQRVMEDGRPATCVNCHATCTESDRVCSRR